MAAESTTVPRTSNELATERTTLADDRTALALHRTILALDRTLMAWVRTATSLISFGFTIYKFFQALQESEQTRDTHVMGPRGVALVMMGLAVGALIAATVHYRQQLRQLHAQYPQYGAAFPRSPTPTVAAIISLLGIVAFVLVLLRQ